MALTTQGEDLADNGYAVIRGFLDAGKGASIRKAVTEIDADGLRHPASEGDHNRLFAVLDDQIVGREWLCSLIGAHGLAQCCNGPRRHPRYLTVRAPGQGTTSNKWLIKMSGYIKGGCIFFQIRQDLQCRRRCE